MPRMKPPVISTTRTKIVATLGPSTESPAMIRKLILAGADVFRLNFSHGEHPGKLEAIQRIRAASEEIGRPIAILGDLSGPKIRLGDIREGEMLLRAGDRITLTGAPADGTGRRVSVTYKELCRVTKPGELIVLDDGALTFRVEKVTEDGAACRVVHGGVLKPRKGVNFPDTKLPIPALTAKDKVDLRFMLDHGVDVVALSFVRTAKDIELARKEMRRHGRIVPLFAKIEKAEAVNNLEEILAVSDGAMVARGDLGVELYLEYVPAIQKRIIHLCNRLAKPVITATQMLDSMIRNPRPTRAETTDVYNAILDGTDAVMLSGETAVGAWPIETVHVMEKIAQQAELTMMERPSVGAAVLPSDASDVSEVVCRLAAEAARMLRLDAIVVPTESGSTARRISRYRPRCPVLAGSVNLSTVNALSLTWGVEARKINDVAPERAAVVAGGEEAVVQESVLAFRAAGLLRRGMRVVVLAGFPLRVPGTTNFLRVTEVP